MSRTTKLFLGTILVLTAGTLFLWFLGRSYRPSDNQENKLKFDKNVWTINWDIHQIGENDRHYMLRDLIDNCLKIGMDTVEVKLLLGEPERDFGFSYNLGLYESGLDPTFLILEFDDQGNLKEIKVETI
jgi:hypothetical protein